MKNSFRPFRRNADSNDALLRLALPPAAPHQSARRSAKTDIFCLADRSDTRNMAYAS
jgi:hypothetical protein